MNQWAIGAVFAVAAFLGMVVMIEVGRRHRRHLVARGGADAAAAGLGTVEGAVFALMGLLVAFTFSGAAMRFDARRTLIVEEANALGTAYLRMELLPADARAALQARFRNYVDVRIAAYHASDDPSRAVALLRDAQDLQGVIWTAATSGCQQAPGTACAVLLLPALNAVFDIATTRSASLWMHPPTVIFALLGMVALACALLAGFSMGARPARSWLHVLGFAAILALTIYITIDLEYPRLGFIRIDAFDQVLIEARASMQ